MKKDLVEVRIHGRGGQGAVTTGQIMAIAAFYDGKQSQTFPIFGVERGGAPVRAFCRISDETINLREQSYNPDVVLVFEPSLVEIDNATEGLKKGGIIIINSNKKPSEFKLTKEFKVHTIDATAAAIKIFGKALGVNMAILGAFAKITKLISIESLKQASDEIWLERKGQKIADLNKKLMQEVYDASK